MPRRDAKAASPAVPGEERGDGAIQPGHRNLLLRAMAMAFLDRHALRARDDGKRPRTWACDIKKRADLAISP